MYSSRALCELASACVQVSEYLHFPDELCYQKPVPVFCEPIRPYTGGQIMADIT